jgi:plasmid stability protein
MAGLVIDWIEDAVVERLERRAKKHGCSLEELVREFSFRGWPGQARP